MIARHPDHLGRWYLQLRERLQTVRTQDLIGLRGSLCAYCGGTRTAVCRGRTQIQGRQRWAEVCASCRRPWSGFEVQVPKQPGTAPVDAEEAALVGLLDRWRQLRPIIEDCPGSLEQDRWEFTRLAWLSYLHDTYGSVAAVVEGGRYEVPAWADWWTPARVRWSIRFARALVRERGQVAGLL